MKSSNLVSASSGHSARHRSQRRENSGAHAGDGSGGGVSLAGGVRESGHGMCAMTPVERLQNVNTLSGRIKVTTAPQFFSNVLSQNVIVRWRVGSSGRVLLYFSVNTAQFVWVVKNRSTKKFATWGGPQSLDSFRPSSIWTPIAGSIICWSEPPCHLARSG